MKILNENEVKKLWEGLNEKDEFTADHCRRVSEMAGKFAREFEWPEEEINEIKIAGLLHDIGKLEVPDEIFEKLRAGDRLTEKELATIREHTGHTKLLDQYNLIPGMLEDVLKYHHERYDGTGYPFGLKGDEIPEAVRMISIIDYYDTIVRQRPWKTPKLQKPLGNEEAVKILIEEAHSRFDPDLVVLFLVEVLKIVETRELHLKYSFMSS